MTAAQFRNSNAASYGRTLKLLRATRAPLELACAHDAEAVRILGGDTGVKAAQFYADASPDKLTPRTVSEAVTELLTSKKGRRTENTIS